MRSPKMAAVRWLVCVGFAFVVFLILDFNLFPVDIFLLAVLSVPLVLVFALGAYLARPSVREAIRIFFPLYQGNRAMIRGDFAAAERHYGNAVALAETFGGGRDFYTGTALCQLAEVYRTRGHLTDAEPILVRALEHMERAARAVPTGAAVLWRNREVVALNLSAVYINQGRYAEAEPLCRDALAALRSDPAAGNESRAVALHNLGQVLAARARYAEAEDLNRQALALVTRKRINRASSSTEIVLSSLADLCGRQGRLDEAESLARRALTLAEKSLYGPEHPQPSRYLNVLAETVRRQGRLDEAESLCLRSQALTEKAFGPEHIRLDACLATLARIRIARGRPGEAEPFLRRCLAILDAAVVAEHPERLARRAEFAALLRQLDRPDEAAQWEAVPKPIPVCERVQDQFFGV